MTALATAPTPEPRLFEDEPPPQDRKRLHEPGGRGGLLEVFRYRTILTMLVRRDVRVKYRYSSIGWAWGYVRPTIHFCVYYFIIGVVLGIDKRVDNFGVYVFSGLCIITFFNDTMNSAAKSIVKNRAIVKKVWVPREIFPVAAMMGAGTRLMPPFVILMVGATATGWYFTWIGLAAAIVGVLIVVLFATAFGLLLSALVVYLREIQHALELVGFLTHWLTPMIKPWSWVRDSTLNLGTAGSVILAIYIYNPLCTAIELFHVAFWEPTVDNYFVLSPHLWLRAWIMLGAGAIILVVFQMLFTRLSARLADEL